MIAIREITKQLIINIFVRLHSFFLFFPAASEDSNDPQRRSRSKNQHQSHDEDRAEDFVERGEAEESSANGEVAGG
jgi:hypothetical protein